ncbi:MAG: rRNA cytosine-C5-methyltransferase [Bacteroides sp.]|nr:rRNA cytosine-C5-methyltransferase [Bacteroides sp.]
MELPSSFTEYTRALLGAETYEKLAMALEAEQPVSIRLNPDKWSAPLSGASRVAMQPVPWAAAGYYLDKRPTFTFDPLFHAGCYYVQEASSMFVEQALKRYVHAAPVVMLDLCAAPGGKSTHVRSLLPEGSLLVANEVVRNRSQVLAENLTKWGHPEVVVTNNDPADFAPLTEFFDVILTDVPCSGEGMFRKDPVAVSEWSPENVEVCWQRQRCILSDIWPCLKPGGLLIYSTCTYNAKENEENVRWLRDELGAEVLPLEVPAEWNITGNLLEGEDFPVYRFLSFRTKGEGFFLAVLHKPGSSVETSFSNRLSCREIASGVPARKSGKGGEKRGKTQGRGATSSQLSKEQLSAISSWLTAPGEYEWMLNGNIVSAFPKHRIEELSALRASLRVLQAGVEVAELKGRDWMPAHGLAMSRVLHPDAFTREEIGYEQAIAYLRKEAIVLSPVAPRGIVLLTYQQVPLGFVKNVGNRANNLYPQEWRIRSGYMPKEALPPHCCPMPCSDDCP